MKVGILLMPELLELSDEFAGGTERAMFYDYQILQENNIQTSIYTSAKINTSLKDKYNVVSIYFPEWLNRSLLRGHHRYTRLILNILLKSLYQFFVLVYVIQFAWKARSNDFWYSYNVPLITLVQPLKTINGFHYVSELPLYKLFKNRYSQSRFIFNSKFLERQVTSKYPEILKNSAIIRYFVDTKKFALRKKRNTVPHFAFAGAWLEIKGLFDYLEVLSRLNNEGANFRAKLIGAPDLWKVGYSDNTINSLYAKVENYTRSIPQLKILGKLKYEQLSSFYNDVDYLVIPSQWGETGPYVALEAMCCGVGVLGYTDGGIPEEVVHGVTGYLVDTGSILSLHKIMKRACNSHLRLASPEAIRLHVKDHFSKDIRKKLLMRFFKPKETYHET